MRGGIVGKQVLLYIRKFFCFTDVVVMDVGDLPLLPRVLSQALEPFHRPADGEENGSRILIQRG